MSIKGEYRMYSCGSFICSGVTWCKKIYDPIGGVCLHNSVLLPVSKTTKNHNGDTLIKLIHIYIRFLLDYYGVSHLAYGVSHLAYGVSHLAHGVSHLAHGFIAIRTCIF